MSITKNIITLCMMLFLTACTQKLVYNEDFLHSGPMFIEAKQPEPQPEPEPVPEPLPEPSVAELNERAVTSFIDMGLEAEQTDRGVNVYLPPEIYFQGSSYNIDIAARTKIAQIAGEVNKAYLEERFIEIIGHTDALGPSENNLALSKKRAIASAGELVFSNVSKDRLKVTWKGETQPRYAETRADGSIDYRNRKKNRRVEFTILNPDQE